jgi:hypothetical protein
MDGTLFILFIIQILIWVFLFFFRPKTIKTRFLTGSSKRTRKGQEKDNKRQIKDKGQLRTR